MATRGILYSATGEKYISEAMASAKSSLRFNKIPHCIFCDVAPLEALDGLRFMPLGSSGNGFLDKIRSMAQTPFDQTVFLDTDTHVLADIGELFDLLARFDLAAAHTAGYAKCGDRGQSQAFYDFNTGVIAYRSTPGVKALLDEWYRLSEEWLRAPPEFHMPSFDQAAFRRVVWQSALSIYVLGPEFNYRSAFPGRLVGKARIIHGRNKNYAKVAALINAGTGARIIERFAPDLDW